MTLSAVLMTPRSLNFRVSRTPRSNIVTKKVLITLFLENLELLRKKVL